MKTIIELREEAIKEDKNLEFLLYQKLEEATEEIQRLNNIIDELENWLKEQRDFIQTIDMMPNLKEIKLEHKIMFNDYNNVLDKLKELKESKANLK